MRITYRNNNNKDYWTKRWGDIDADDAMVNEKTYPLKFTNESLKFNNNKSQKILEAGCGPGRIVKYLNNNGYNVTGIDFIGSAINKIKLTDPLLDVHEQSILKTKFKDEEFDTILAFGLYHNFKYDDIILSLNETMRILKKGGILCLSFRLDNIQNFILDKIKDKQREGNKHFHKINLKETELKDILKKYNLTFLKKYYVTNMPLLFHFKLFRSMRQKQFNEHLGRREGYKLNFIGKIINWFLITFLKKKYSNVIVLICKKN